jgi:hypothetical protein
MPVKAIPIRLVLDSASEFDALEEAVLALLRLAPRDVPELARKLHLPESFVSSALGGLADRSLVAAPEQQEALYRPSGDARAFAADKARPGFAFFAPATGGLLPVVVEGSRLPPRTDVDSLGTMISVEGERPSASVPKRAELEGALRTLLATRDVFVVSVGTRGGERGAVRGEVGVELDGDALPSFGAPQSSPRLRSAVLEPLGGIHSQERCTAWVCVDLLPRMRGASVPVLHEPVVYPEYQPEAPVAPVLAEWLQEHDGAAWQAVEAAGASLHIDMSLVLTRAGIDSMEKLDEAVQRHSLEQLDRVCLHRLAGPPGGGELVDKVREAQRWLVLAQREPAYFAQAHDAWAHVIEELGAALAELARPYLADWKRRARRRPPPTAAEFEERLVQVGLAGRLGPSARHVQKAATDPELASRLDVGAAGVGSGISLWLLPALLLEPEEARRYAQPIAVATTRYPELFDALAELTNIRDFRFHEGRTRHAELVASSVPEHIEQRFFAAFAALHVGLEDAPPVRSKHA